MLIEGEFKSDKYFITKHLIRLELTDAALVCKRNRD